MSCSELLGRICYVTVVLCVLLVEAHDYTVTISHGVKHYSPPASYSPPNMPLTLSFDSGFNFQMPKTRQNSRQVSTLVEFTNHLHHEPYSKAGGFEKTTVFKTKAPRTNDRGSERKVHRSDPVFTSDENHRESYYRNNKYLKNNNDYIGNSRQPQRFTENSQNFYLDKHNKYLNNDSDGGPSEFRLGIPPIKESLPPRSNPKGYSSNPDRPLTAEHVYPPMSSADRDYLYATGLIYLKDPNNNNGRG